MLNNIRFIRDFSPAIYMRHMIWGVKWHNRPEITSPVDSPCTTVFLVAFSANFLSIMYTIRKSYAFLQLSILEKCRFQPTLVSALSAGNDITVWILDSNFLKVGRWKFSSISVKKLFVVIDLAEKRAFELKMKVFGILNPKRTLVKRNPQKTLRFRIVWANVRANRSTVLIDRKKVKWVHFYT